MKLFSFCFTRACTYAYVILVIYILRKGAFAMARSSRLESGFQDKLRDELKSKYPDSLIFKMDQIQGIPDMLILYKNKYAFLENKKSANAPHQPNQDYYVDKLNNMSFARFVYPENKDNVLEELDLYFRD